MKDRKISWKSKNKSTKIYPYESKDNIIFHEKLDNNIDFYFAYFDLKYAS